MSGQPVLEETMVVARARPSTAKAHDLHARARDGRPGAGGRPESLIERFGHAQACRRAALAALEAASARDPGEAWAFDEVVETTGKLSGRLEDARVALARILLSWRKPPPPTRCCSTSRPQLPRHRVHHLASRALPARLRGRADHDVARPRVLKNRLETTSSRIDGGDITTYAEIMSHERKARSRPPSRGAVRAPAGDARAWSRPSSRSSRRRATRAGPVAEKLDEIRVELLKRCKALEFDFAIRPGRARTS